MFNPLQSLALVALGLAAGAVVGFILLSISRMLPGRRSLRVWAVVGGVTLALLLAALLGDIISGLRDAVASELEQREFWDTAAFVAGFCLPVLGGFVAGLMFRARMLAASAEKAPTGPLPPHS